VARRGERIDVQRVLVGRPEEKRPLGRHGHRWDDDDDDNNNNNNTNKTSRNRMQVGVDRSGSGEGRVTGPHEGGNEASFSIKCGKFVE
jgi:hypothetical protein